MSIKSHLKYDGLIYGKHVIDDMLEIIMRGIVMNQSSRMLSKKLWNKDYILLLLVCTIASVTNSVFTSILPVYVLDIGGTNTDTGMMMTGLTILGMITRIIVAPLIDRTGRKKLIVIGSGLYFVNSLLFCFTSDLKVIFVLRVLHGFTQGIFFPVPPTMVADISPANMLVDAIGFFGIASSVAMAITPSVGLAIYERTGALMVFAIASIAALISFVLALFINEHYVRKSIEEDPDKKGAQHKLSKSFIIVISIPSVIMLFLSIGNSSITNFITPCGLSRGIQNISIFFLVNHITMIIFRLFIGRLIRKVSEQICIFSGIILSAIGTGTVAFANDMLLIIIAAIMVGIGMTAASQLLQVQILSSVPDNKRGVANSVYMLLSDTGNGIGSALWGFISTGSGYVLTYIAAGMITAVACLFHSFYWKKKQK
jgi:predicted MFS family arabinose efflux permease